MLCDKCEATGFLPKTIKCDKCSGKGVFDVKQECPKCRGYKKMTWLEFAIGKKEVPPFDPNDYDPDFDIPF